MGVQIVTPTSGMTRLNCHRSPRVGLATDVTSADPIPSALRNAADTLLLGDLSVMGKRAISENSDGVLIWTKDEKVTHGTTAEWRRAFFTSQPCNKAVVIHWLCIEHADLLNAEPRILMNGANRTATDSHLRIVSGSPSPKMRTAWKQNGEPWSRVTLAVWDEIENPGTGVDALRALWEMKNSDQTLSALILRNLIVVLMRRGDFEKAEELLALGEKAFPGYPELSYLHAVLHIRQNRHSRAIKFLEAAMTRGNLEFVGSGGENSYRARFLLGAIYDMVGKQEEAVNYWVPCINERPTFPPAVLALLGQQIPRGRAAWLHQPLGEMVRRENQYLEPVLNFMLAHYMLAPAKRLVTTMQISQLDRERYMAAIARVEGKLAPRKEGSQSRPGVVLSGPFLDASAHSRINRAFATALLNCNKVDASFDSTTWPKLALNSIPQGQRLWKAIQRQSDHLDLTIRHTWPPNFERPKSGKLVCILPWEHTSVPVKWVEEIENKVDELWTPSDFVRKAFLEGGVSSDRVRTLRNGVDMGAFRPEGRSTRPPGSRGFVFLFVGGSIQRKGIDLLLQAYGDAFTLEDDVTLVVKDLGSRSFYREITRLGDVQQFAAKPTSPHTIVVTEELNDDGLAALYRGADAFVLPYRGEGFGMPMLESMACGTPIIATAEGPAAELCSAEEGYLIPAEEVPVPESGSPLGRFTREWTWFEPNIELLAQTMRRVYEDRDDAAKRGRKAAASAKQKHTWDRVLPEYLARVSELTRIDGRN